MKVVNDNEITYTDRRFYETADGWVPRVTTILGECYPKGPEMIQWWKQHGTDSDALLREAADRGTVVHTATEDYDRGGSLYSEHFSQEEWEMICKYDEFRRVTGITYEAIELHMASYKLGYGGTLDRVGTIDGKRYLIDIKTSKSIYLSFYAQVAAYHQLYTTERPDIHIDYLAILHLNSMHRGPDLKGKKYQGKGWELAVVPIKDAQQHLDIFNLNHQMWLKISKAQQPHIISLPATLKAAI